MTDTLAPLVRFTGYHTLSGDGVGSGAFLAISTTQTYENGAITGLVVSLAVSLDGKTSRNFTDLVVTSASGDSADVSVRENGVEAMTVHFDRVVGEGLTGRCTGKTKEGQAFAGASAFNSAPLELFAGRYLDMTGQHVSLDIVVGMKGTTIAYATEAGGEPRPFPKYTYVPDMYVLSLAPIDAGAPPVAIMLGTGGALGLVAGITTPTGVTYGVTIPPGALVQA